MQLYEIPVQDQVTLLQCNLIIKIRLTQYKEHFLKSIHPMYGKYIQNREFGEHLYENQKYALGSGYSPFKHLLKQYPESTSPASTQLASRICNLNTSKLLCQFDIIPVDSGFRLLCSRALKSSYFFVTSHHMNSSEHAAD